MEWNMCPGIIVMHLQWPAEQRHCAGQNKKKLCASVWVFHSAVTTGCEVRLSAECWGLIPVALEVLSGGAGGLMSLAGIEVRSDSEKLVAHEVLESTSVAVEVADISSDMAKLDSDSVASSWEKPALAVSSRDIDKESSIAS